MFSTTQDKLFHEIQGVCGSEKVTEDQLRQLPYLSAIFHETLRKHGPVPIVPLRYVYEDVELGGYHIPAGTEVNYLVSYTLEILQIFDRHFKVFNCELLFLRLL